MSDSTVNNQTILLDNIIVESIAKFMTNGDAAITYWLDKQLGVRGIAIGALKKLLTTEATRPILGQVAFDNFGSQQIL